MKRDRLKGQHVVTLGEDEVIITPGDNGRFAVEVHAPSGRHVSFRRVNQEVEPAEGEREDDAEGV